MERYFEIRTPRPDYTGVLGAVAFANGKAVVSFDDTRDASGACPADEHQVQVGRSAVLAARRRGYTVTEVNALGQPLPEPAEAAEEPPAEDTSAKPAPRARKDS